VVDVSPHLRPRREELALGYPLLASAGGTGDEASERARVLAGAALAISAGCRLVRTADMRGVHRVRDVLAAVLAAGAVPVPVNR
jgi:hypothetical protein